MSLSYGYILCTSAFSALFCVSLTYLCINYHKENDNNDDTTNYFTPAHACDYSLNNLFISSLLYSLKLFS